MKKNIVIVVLLGIIFSSFVVDDSVFLKNLLIHSYMEGHREGHRLTLRFMDMKGLRLYGDYNKLVKRDSIRYADKVNCVNLKIVTQ